MLSKNELRYTLALQRVPNIGDATAKKLIHKVGSAEGIFNEKKSNLLKISGVGSFKLKEISKKIQLDEADEEMRFIEENKLNWLYFEDNLYPERLKYCVDGPILYFQKGNINLQKHKIISIVGARKITNYGKVFCEKLIEELAPINPIIISGFAYGVDITAHKAAIENGLQTVACLAHGLNQIYPKKHKRYVNNVMNNGGFISEFWSSDAFNKTNFLKRNRIIAGMSQATIVIESAAKGGSLVTADIANSYSRDVFAVPGRATDTQSQGCNMLIKTHQASIITSAADLVYHLGWDLDEIKKPTLQPQLFTSLEGEEKILFNFLKDKDKVALDAIAVGCEMPTYKVAQLLLKLEMKSLVRPLPGKLFQWI